MKKTIIISVIISIVVVTFGIYYYFYCERKIDLLEEYELYSKRKTWGLAWGIIISEEVRKSIVEEFGVDIPKIDFNKNYLLYSDGRRVKKITYTIGSKFKSRFDVPKGIEVFGEKHYPHTFFIYKINKILVKQGQD